MTTHDEPRPGDTDDLIWLADRRPIDHELGSDAASRARDALLAHIHTQTAAKAPLETAPPAITAAAPAGTFSVAGRGRGRGPWLRRTTAAAALAAVTVTVVFGALPAGRGGAGNALSPAAAEAAPLVKLSRSISTTPTPSGDATLTHTNAVTTGARPDEFDKYHLVLDRQFQEFYGATLPELRTAEGGTNTLTGEIKKSGRGTISGWIQAAADSAGKSPREAAAAIEAASGIPIIAPSKDPAVHERQRKEQYDNHVWITALDVIELAGGRPDVRSGALAAMASVGATTTQAVEAGRDVLRVTLRNPSTEETSGEQTMTIDARTGIPIRFTAGAIGKAPITTATYEVTRVNAADYGH